MANINSISSGAWSAGSTWSGGAVPSSGDNVRIEAGHTVTVEAPLSLGGTCVLNGTLAIKANVVLKIGIEGGSGSDCAFTHGPGSVLTGEGVVTHIRGRVQSTATAGKRAVVSGSLSFSQGGVADNARGKVNYDLAHVDFRHTGATRFCSTMSRGSYPESHVFHHCTFSGQEELAFGIAGWSADGDIVFSDTHFDNCGIISFNMNSPTTSGKRIIKRCVLYADSQYTLIRYNAAGPWQVTDSVFINYVPDAASTNRREQHFSGCFFSQNTKAQNQSLFNYDAASTADDCYFYTNPGEYNPHVISIATLRGGVCECESPVEPNIHAHGAQNVLLENVLHLGYGDLDNRVGTVSQNRIVRNCTRVSPKGSPINALSLHENGVTNGSVTISGCLHACLDPAGSDSRCCRIVGANGRTQNITFEYNAKYNVREWFENGIVNLAVKSPNLELEADPGFKDATRGLLSWLQKKAGLAAPDYLAGYAYFRGLLGFDQSKKTLKPENEIPLTPGDLVSWVREGYTTGNPLLAVSGIDGGHIGIGVFDTGEPGQEVEKSSHLRFTRPSFGSGVTE